MRLICIVNYKGSFTIGNHDTYTVGEFKDDCIQNITGKNSFADADSGRHIQITAFDDDSALYGSGGAQVMYGSGSSYKPYTDLVFDASRCVRTSDNTHGKQVGVNYLIKSL